MVQFDFRKLDVFSFGENQNCLVGALTCGPQLVERSATLHFNGEQWMIESLKSDLAKCIGRPPPDSVEVFCYSQHLRGLIRTRVQQLVSECIELRLPAPARKPGDSRRCAFLVEPGACSSNA